jgi:hypothetical protein
MNNAEALMLDIKKNMEIEGFNIPDELAEQGLKILNGELNCDNIIEARIKKIKQEAY